METPNGSPHTPDAPDPPASSLSPTSGSTQRPRRPWTILGRLSQAVREQNWFAVVLEVAIVVLGVVIGFQVTGWGQARSDAAKEQVYLRQLAADLDETESMIRDVNTWMAKRERAGGEFVRAFRSPERPPRDSLIWWRHLQQFKLAVPVMGTVNALLATGDLALIRDDSLRSAITAYSQTITRITQNQQSWAERLRDGRAALEAPMSMYDVRAELTPPVVLDSMARADPMLGIQTGDARIPFPFTVESVLTNREAATAAAAIQMALRNLRGMRRNMLRGTVALRQRVDAQIDP